MTERDISKFKDSVALEEFFIEKSSRSEEAALRQALSGNYKGLYSDPVHIPKKTGGYRVIIAPTKPLKKQQRELAKLIEKWIERKGHVNLSHGFKKGTSIFTNAEIHRNKKFVLNFDIKNFFPSIHYGRVLGLFEKKLLLNKDVAESIARISCYYNKEDGTYNLPQGSPCSPIISNLMGHYFLDIPIMRFIKKYNCDYSRYADDITISTNSNEFPREIASYDATEKKWILSNSIEREIEKRAFRVNPDKTRLQPKHKRQVVTGLVVNEKVNIQKRYFKVARTMVHKLFTEGDFEIFGNISPSHNNDKGENNLKDNTLRGKMMRLEGIINHIYNTKSFDSRNLDFKLISDFIESRKKHFENWVYLDKLLIESAKIRAVNDSVRNLYKDFLFYKYFCFEDRESEKSKYEAVIFCEGSSDIKHIKSALKKNQFVDPDKYPLLITKDKSNKHKFNIRFPQNSKKARYFFRLGKSVDKNGEISLGIGEFKKIVKLYEATKEKLIQKKYSRLNPNIPVIFVCDNDAAALKGFLNPMIEEYENLATQQLTLENDDKKYFKITEEGNLYIVKLPHHNLLPNCDMDIEGMFDDNNPLKQQFNSDKNKMKFAEQISRNYKNIDFSRFEELLDRIQQVIIDHYEIQETEIPTP